MRKIIFQMTIGEKPAIVYEIPSNEKFIDFLQFNSLADLKFNSGSTNFDACSSFLFLTQKKNRIIVNLLLIDPYL